METFHFILIIQKCQQQKLFRSVLKGVFNFYIIICKNSSNKRNCKHANNKGNSIYIHVLLETYRVR